VWGGAKKIAIDGSGKAVVKARVLGDKRTRVGEGPAFENGEGSRSKDESKDKGIRPNLYPRAYLLRSRE